MLVCSTYARMDSEPLCECLHSLVAYSTVICGIIGRALASPTLVVVSRAALYGAVLRICMSICLPFRKSSACKYNVRNIAFISGRDTVNRRARESAGTETTKAQIDRNLPTSVPPQWRQQRRTPLVDLPIH